MEKKYNFFSISLEKFVEGNLDRYFKKFYDANDNSINIVYITKNDLMYGTVTVGDFNRGNREDIDLINIINTNCKYIVYNDDMQVEKDAKEIFRKYSKINSIPVVDTNKKILFVYNRLVKETNYIFRYLLETEDFKYYNNLLKFCNRHKIVVVSDTETVTQINKYINKNMIPINEITCCSYKEDLYNINDSVIIVENMFDVYYIKSQVNKTNIVLSAKCCRSISGTVSKIYYISKKSIEKSVELFPCIKIVFGGKYVKENEYIEILNSKFSDTNVETEISNDIDLWDVFITMDKQTEKKYFLPDLINNVLLLWSSFFVTL